MGLFSNMFGGSSEKAVQKPPQPAIEKKAQEPDFRKTIEVDVSSVSEGSDADSFTGLANRLNASPLECRFGKFHAGFDEHGTPLFNKVEDFYDQYGDFELRLVVSGGRLELTIGLIGDPEYAKVSIFDATGAKKFEVLSPRIDTGMLRFDLGKTLVPAKEGRGYDKRILRFVVSIQLEGQEQHSYAVTVDDQHLYAHGL